MAHILLLNTKIFFYIMLYIYSINNNFGKLILIMLLILLAD